MARLDYLCEITRPAVVYALNKMYKIHYEGKLPAKGAYILFSKHQTWLDQFLIGVYIRETTSRLASYIMRRFKFPLNHILTLYGGINIARPKELQKRVYSRQKAEELNKRAIEKAIHVLKRGEPLVIFPEGTRGYQTMGTKLKMRIPEEIIKANIPELQFIPLGMEVEDIDKPGSNIWLRAGQTFYTNNISTLEQRLFTEIARLSGF